MSNKLFSSPSNTRKTIQSNPYKYNDLNAITKIMNRVEHKLAFRAQLYLYSFVAIALSLLLVVLCHLYLPLLAAGLSLIAVGATCVFAALVVLWFDRRISNSVRDELSVLNEKFSGLHMSFLKAQNNQYADDDKQSLNLHAHLYLEAGMTLLFQSQAIPNRGGNFMLAGYGHLANLAAACEEKEALCLNYGQMHELYKVLCGHSKAMNGLVDNDYKKYKERMNFYGALKQWNNHNQKVQSYEVAPLNKMSPWFSRLKFWCKGVLAYHRSQRATMRKKAFAIFNAQGLNAFGKTSLTTALNKQLVSVNENTGEQTLHGSTTKKIFSSLGSTIDYLDVGVDYLKHGFVNRVFHEVTSVGKGVKGAVELLTPHKFGSSS